MYGGNAFANFVQSLGYSIRIRRFVKKVINTLFFACNENAYIFLMGG